MMPDERSKAMLEQAIEILGGTQVREIVMMVYKLGLNDGQIQQLESVLKHTAIIKATQL